MVDLQPLEVAHVCEWTIGKVETYSLRLSPEAMDVAEKVRINKPRLGPQY